MDKWEELARMLDRKLEEGKKDKHRLSEYDRGILQGFVIVRGNMRKVDREECVKLRCQSFREVLERLYGKSDA